MATQVIADSSNEMNKDLMKENPVEIVPFRLYLDGTEYVDDENLNVIEFIDIMMKSKTLPKSACPSPEEFMNKFKNDDDSYVVAISSKLSGTYNSAMLAKNLYLEDVKEKFIHVFDSKTASVGETLVSLKIHELSKLGHTRDDLVVRVEKYIAEMKTFFVSESLDNLMKNGRISKFKGTLATALKIRPIMRANDDGELEMVDKARGSAKAYNRLAEIIEENALNQEERVLAISHVNNIDRANWLKDEVEKRCNFKKIVVLQTKGLSSLYCDNQGIIVAF
ncbi:MAG: DegV family protein [Acidaminobacteraceae bacterium]